MVNKKIFPKLSGLVILALLVVTISNVSFAHAQSENKSRIPYGDISSIQEIKQKYANFSDKINSHVLDVVTSDNPSQVAKQMKINFQDGKITVYVYLDSSENQNDIPKNIKIISSSENIAVANVNLQQINQLSKLDFVQRIDVPVSGRLVTSDISEGVAFSFADEMHAQNLTGNGIKVAVIDGGFFVSDPQISSNVVFSKICTAFGTVRCGDATSNSHGTAVAEVVVDMAPDVQLYLYSTNSAGGIDLVDVQNAIDDAISKNVDIITMSFGFRGIGGDGNSGFEKDGTSSLSKKVNNAKNAGILVTVASGNTAKMHWSGTYSASSVPPSAIGIGELTDYQSVMEFRPIAVWNQKACLPVTDIGGSYLAQWNDWTTTNQDYDLFLYDYSLSALIGASAEEQSGVQPPLEAIPPGPPIGAGCIVLASWSSTQNHYFHIEMDNLVDPNVGNADGSITIPADSAGALAVGAINQASDQFEDFSSRGPTDDSRLKPEICGPDNTSSHQSQLNPFVGTSASAPHVAGAAALLLEQTPNLSVDQLIHRLTDESRFNANYSIDNLCGGASGALSLHTAAQTDVYIPLGDSSPGCENTNSCYLPFNQTISSGTQVTWYNGDSAAHTVTSGNPQDGPDEKFDSSLFMSGTSFSHTFSSAGSFDYFCMVHPWMKGTITVNPTPCSVPISGDWNVTSDCSVMNNSTASGNVIVQNNSVLTIPDGITLDIDFANFNLTVKSGSGVLIKSGGRIA